MTNCTCWCLSQLCRRVHGLRGLQLAPKYWTGNLGIHFFTQILMPFLQSDLTGLNQLRHGRDHLLTSGSESAFIIHRLLLNTKQNDLRWWLCKHPEECPVLTRDLSMHIALHANDTCYKAEKKVINANNFADDGFEKLPSFRLLWLRNMQTSFPRMRRAF